MFHNLQELLYKHIVPYLTDDLKADEFKDYEHPLAGHCYIASEAAYHLLGASQSGFIPCRITHEGISHWFLRQKITKEVIDLTYEQFETEVPYKDGKGSGFLTAKPSKRALIIMERMLIAKGHQVAKNT